MILCTEEAICKNLGLEKRRHVGPAFCPYLDHRVASRSSLDSPPAALSLIVSSVVCSRLYLDPQLQLLILAG
jgi:hypothetical protein